jgi:hypothetical protein
VCGTGGDESDAAMQAILTELKHKFPGQTQLGRQAVSGAITFTRTVFASNSENSENEEEKGETRSKFGSKASSNVDSSGSSASSGSSGACEGRHETAPQVIFYMRPSVLAELVAQDKVLAWAEDAVAKYPAHAAPLLLVVGLDNYLQVLSLLALLVRK